MVYQNIQSFSDIAWLKWKATTGSFPSTMRYFASISITNLETNGVISIVLDKARYKEVPAWPGYDIEANTEQGAALLAKLRLLYAIEQLYIFRQHHFI